MRFSPAALLGAAVSAVLAVPAIQQPQQPSTNASVVSPTPFELTIVRVQPAGGCPAIPTACPADNIFGSAPKPKASPGAGTDNPSRPVISSSAEPMKLLPGVHWGTNTNKISNAIPVAGGDGSRLYYGSSDPSKAGYLGFLTYTFGSPSVNLDHCGFLSVVCTATGCTVTFSSKEAYDQAVKTWGAGLILITYTAGCSAHANGDRCFFSVTAIDLGDGLDIIVSGSFKDPKTIMDKAEANWGWWEPGRPPKPGSGSTTTTVTSSRPTSTTSSRGPIGTGPAGSNSSSPSNPYGSPAGSFGGSGACEPPVDTKYGLPTACLGEHFDADLDEDLGFVGTLPAGFEAFVKSLVASHDLGGVTKRSGLAPIHYHEKRIFGKIFGTLIKIVTAPITYPASAIILLANGGKPLTNSLRKDLSFKLPDPGNPGSDANKLQDKDAKQVVSPWGDAILIKSFGDAGGSDPSAPPREGLSGYMNVFCVGCGASGQISMAGSITWLPIGIQAAKVDIKADAEMKLKLGVDAQVRYETNIRTTLIRVGLPGLSFGVVTIGPWVEAGVRVGLTALAKGRLLVGAEMGLSGSRVTLDLMDSSKSNKAGWDPQFKPVLEAEGEIILSAELGLPIGLKIGVAVAGFKLDAGIVDEPSIKGTAQVAASVGLTPARTFSAGFKEVNGCTGICTQISWRNRLFLEANGVMLFSPLHDTGEKLLVRGCIALPGRPGDGGGAQKRSSPSYPLLTNSTSKTDKYANLTIPTNLKDLTSSVKGKTAGLTYTPASLPSKPYNDTSGGEYSLLTVPDGSMVFVACGSGGIYAVSPGADSPYCSELWAAFEDILVSDGAGRVLHYYANTMAAAGVSRLLVSDEANIPKQAVGVVLSPDGAGGSHGYHYLAVDPEYRVFYPVMCGFEDGASPRLFLAADPVKGVEMLQSPDVQYTVTGGKVRQCFAMTLMMGEFEGEGNSFDQYVDHGNGDKYPFDLGRE